MLVAAVGILDGMRTCSGVCITLTLRKPKSLFILFTGSILVDNALGGA